MLIVLLRDWLTLCCPRDILEPRPPAALVALGPASVVAVDSADNPFLASDVSSFAVLSTVFFPSPT